MQNRLTLKKKTKAKSIWPSKSCVQFDIRCHWRMNKNKNPNQCQTGCNCLLLFLLTAPASGGHNNFNILWGFLSCWGDVIAAWPDDDHFASACEPSNFNYTLWGRSVWLTWHGKNSCHCMLLHVNDVGQRWWSSSRQLWLVVVKNVLIKLWGHGCYL